MLSLVLVFLFAAPPDLAAGLARCAAITDSAERLKCFDSLAATAVPKSDATPALPPNAGKWKLRKQTSPLDDSTTVAIALMAESPIRGWLRESTPTLAVRCSPGGSTDVLILTGRLETHTVGQSQYKAGIRFDKEPAREELMYLLKDDDGLISNRSRDFIQELLEHETLVVAFWPFKAAQAYATFDLRGTAEAIKPIGEACGWKAP